MSRPKPCVFGRAILAGILLAAAPAGATEKEDKDEKPGAKEHAETCTGPDFAFLANSAYLQGQLVPQLIWTNAIGVDRELQDDGTVVRRRSLVGTMRIEFGLTDRLELDAVGGYRSEWERADDTPTRAVDGASDTLFGLRYLVLREDTEVMNLSFGPQLLLPTDDRDKGLSESEGAGFALAINASKDFGRVFLYADLNWARWPGVNDPLPGSQREFDVDHLAAQFTLGVKLIESWDGDMLHDLHGYLEFGAYYDDGIDTDDPSRLTGFQENVESFVLAPGIRYGYETAADRLWEVGVSVPIGLDHDANAWAVVVQFQYEQPF